MSAPRKYPDEVDVRPEVLRTWGHRDPGASQGTRPGTTTDEEGLLSALR